jgi:hypothetical protein
VLWKVETPFVVKLCLDFPIGSCLVWCPDSQLVGGKREGRIGDRVGQEGIELVHSRLN